MQIAKLSEGAQHGGEQKSLEAFSTGATLSPASSDDMKNWYICQSWDNQGLVTDYSVPSFETGNDAKSGNYKVSGNDYYAFIRSDYIVYTITETGTADVYLAVEDDQSPITITAKNGNGSEIVTGSMRVAITTQEVAADGKTPVGEETLRVVYAKDDEAKTLQFQPIQKQLQQMSDMMELPYMYISGWKEQTLIVSTENLLKMIRLLMM